MATKITLFINEGTQGWTETYWCDAGLDTVNFLGSGIWRSWLQARANCLTQQATIYAARTSIFQGAKQSKLNVFAGLYNGTVAPSSSDTAAGETGGIYPTVDLLIGAQTNAFKQRSLWLRGAPSFWVGQNPNTGAQILTASVGNALTVLYRSMNACALQIRYITPAGTSGVHTSQVVSVAPVQTNPNLSTITAIQAGFVIPIGTNYLVRFGQIPRDDLPGFPAIATASATTAAGGQVTFTIPYRFRASTAVYTPAKMYVSNLVYGYDSIGFWGFKAVSSHKTGRAFGVPRGRNRSVVRAL